MTNKLDKTTKMREISHNKGGNMSEIKKAMDVHLERELVESKVDNYLQKNGWERTCQVPGSLWLWQRTLKDGRVMLVSKETAIHMTNFQKDFA